MWGGAGGGGCGGCCLRASTTTERKDWGGGSPHSGARESQEDSQVESKCLNVSIVLHAKRLCGSPVGRETRVLFQLLCGNLEQKGHRWAPGSNPSSIIRVLKVTPCYRQDRGRGPMTRPGAVREAECRVGTGMLLSSTCATPSPPPPHMLHLAQVGHAVPQHQKVLRTGGIRVLWACADFSVCSDPRGPTTSPDPPQVLWGSPLSPTWCTRGSLSREAGRKLVPGPSEAYGNMLFTGPKGRGTCPPTPSWWSLSLQRYIVLPSQRL